MLRSSSSSSALAPNRTLSALRRCTSSLSQNHQFYSKKLRTNNHQFSSTTSIIDLSNDLLVEILCKVGAIKCIVHCECVSKLWYTLISTICIPKLTSGSAHAILYNTAILSPSILTKRAKIGLWSFASTNSPNIITPLTEMCHFLPFTPSPKEFFDCCNGFLLFFHQSSTQYYLCNPSTEQYMVIPNSPQNDVAVCGLLVFNPHCKVVHISFDPLAVNIFSVENREWVVHHLHNSSIIATNGLLTRQIYVNGSIYGLSFCGYMLKFDIKQKYDRVIKLPISGITKHPIGCIGMCQDRLQYSWTDEKSQLMVWTLSEIGDTDEWVLKHTICHQYYGDHPLCTDLVCNDLDKLFIYVFAFDPTSNVLFIGNNNMICRYDPCTKRLETICTLKPDTCVWSAQYKVFPFSPNLTTLDTIGTYKVPLQDIVVCNPLQEELL